MKKTKTTRKPVTRRDSVPVPATLIALAALVQESSDPSVVLGALTAARAALQSHSVGDYPDAIHEYIDHFARTGWAKDAVLRMEKRDADGDLFAGIHNAFATPGMLAGLALAYIVLMNDGGAR